MARRYSMSRAASLDLATRIATTPLVVREVHGGVTVFAVKSAVSGQVLGRYESEAQARHEAQERIGA